MGEADLQKKLKAIEAEIDQLEKNGSNPAFVSDMRNALQSIKNDDVFSTLKFLMLPLLREGDENGEAR